jgi:hypothetical protein
VLQLCSCAFGESQQLSPSPHCCCYCCWFLNLCHAACLSRSGTIALGGTLAYILSFAIGAGPVSGLIVPEINKEAVRGEPAAAAAAVAAVQSVHLASKRLLLLLPPRGCTFSCPVSLFGRRLML